MGNTQTLQNGYGRHTDRADHIDKHVTKEGRNMEAYVSLERHLKKQDDKPDASQQWFLSQKPQDHDSHLPHAGSKAKQSQKRKYTQFKGEALGSDSEERKKIVAGARWGCVSA
jgi:hypothetical protein